MTRQLITPLKNKYPKSDIYVVASGKSMDFINPTFFDNKLSIGINYVINRFPNLTYYLCKENYVAQELTNRNVEVVCSEYDCGSLIKQKNIFDCWYFKHKENHEIEIEDVFDLEGYLTVSWSTITSAIHFAYYLGAKNILIGGHDCGLLDGQSNIANYNSKLRVMPQPEYEGWLSKIEGQTIKMREMLNKRGVNLYSLNPFVNFGLEGHTYSKTG